MLLPLLFISFSAVAQSDLNSVPQGFPVTWDGDSYKQAECQVIQKPPSWVDGFLIAQTSGSYGDQSNPAGQKLTHVFDAISGVSVYDVSPNNKSTFTGAYYPTKANKIWNYYDRDFKKSKVAWGTMFSPVNATATKMWSQMESDTMTDPPNVDFWKIGNTIVAGTENYAQFGFQFDLPKVDNFKQYPFQDADDAILKKQLIAMHIPIHEHVDPETGLIWSASIVMNVTAQPIPTFHEIVFTVDPKGVRKIQGVFNFAPVDISKCLKNGTYTGPTSGNGIYFPRNMHTVTATQNYLILPMSSLQFRPCQILMQTPYIPENATVFDPYKNFIFEWVPTAPSVFLLFDKKNKKFLDPIEYSSPLFFTHQFNSYETGVDGQIYTDILAFDSPAYDALAVDILLKKGDHSELNNHAYRFTIDYKKKTATTRSLLPPNDPTKLEFSQINHAFEGKKYKYGYAVQFPFLQPNQIIKIDMDTPSGEKNKYFKPSEFISMAEPYFNARPGGTEEDDGVIVVRGLDVSINKTRIYVVDAKSMQKIGEILSPYYTPFGLHERFYRKDQLGLKSGTDSGSSSGGAGMEPGFFNFFGGGNFDVRK